MRPDRWRLVAALAAALTLAPGAQALAQDAPDTVARARAAQAAGDSTRAIALLEQARAERPRDPEVLRLLGSNYAFARRYPDAIATLREAQTLAPADLDIALALARTYLWSGDTAAAAAEADAIARTNPGNAELRDLQQAIARARKGAAPQRRQVVASLAQSVSAVKVNGGNRTWYDTAAALAVPIGSGGSLGGQIDRESREGPVDTRLELRFDQRIGRSAGAYLAVAATPHADFRERRSISGGGEVAASRIVTLTFDLRYAEYTTTSVVVATPGVRLHSADERLSLAVRQISLWADNDSYRAGWAVRGEAQVARRVRVVGGGATYPDTEAGITRRVRSGFAGMILDIGKGATLRATYQHENRAQSYTLDSAVVAASLRF